MKPQVLKLTFGLVAMVAITFMFSGCDLFSKADNITFEQEFKLNTTVAVTVVGGETAYPVPSQTVNLADNAEVQKYIDKIQEISITSIKYHVENYSQKDNSAVFFKNGIAKFSAASGSPEVTATFTDNVNGVNLKTSTNDADLIISSADLAKVAAAFKTEKAIKFSAYGYLTETPVAFKLVTTVKVKITAKAL
jgi:hypothetical protein